MYFIHAADLKRLKISTICSKKNLPNKCPYEDGFNDLRSIAEYIMGFEKTPPATKQVKELKNYIRKMISFSEKIMDKTGFVFSTETWFEIINCNYPDYETYKEDDGDGIDYDDLFTIAFEQAALIWLYNNLEQLPDENITLFCIRLYNRFCELNQNDSKTFKTFHKRSKEIIDQTRTAYTFSNPLAFTLGITLTYMSSDLTELQRMIYDALLAGDAARFKTIIKDNLV